MRRLLFVLLLAVISAFATTAQEDSTQVVVNDTVPRLGWWQAIKQNKFDINDTTIVYPKMMNFGIKVYRWWSKHLNTYDTTYVTSSGKKWRFQVRYNGLFGVYHATDDNFKNSIFLSSEVSSNAGVRVAYKGFGIEYMPDIDNFIHGKILDHRKTRFSLNTSRFSLETYYIKSSSTTHIHRFLNYNKGKYINLPFYGFDRRVLGVEAFYIFNYMHYAHSAGYGLSKIQRKSSGSFILGFQYSKQEANLDASMFPSQLKHIVPEHFPDELRFHFKDYAISLGYAYNWVFHRNWLFNITAAPALGLKTIKEFPLDDKKSHITTNFRGRIALVYMKGKFFYGLNGSVNGYWFITKGYDFFANIVDFNAIIGVEF